MKQIIGALNKIMQSCGYIQKTGKNAFHGYKYAGEADLLEKLRPAMVEAGLILIPSVTEQSGIDEFGNTRVRIEYTLAHVSGEVWPHPIVAQGCGNDKNKNGVGDKGLYKAITGANKYLLFKLFQIETGDDPDSAESPSEPAKPNGATRPAAPALPKPPHDAQVVAALDAISDWDTVINDIIAEIAKTKTPADLAALYPDHQQRMAKAPAEMKQRVLAIGKRHHEDLMKQIPAMAAG